MLRTERLSNKVSRSSAVPNRIGQFFRDREMQSQRQEIEHLVENHTRFADRFQKIFSDSGITWKELLRSYTPPQRPPPDRILGRGEMKGWGWMLKNSDNSKHNPIKRSLLYYRRGDNPGDTLTENEKQLIERLDAEAEKRSFYNHTLSIYEAEVLERAVTDVRLKYLVIHRMKGNLGVSPEAKLVERYDDGDTSIIDNTRAGQVTSTLRADESMDDLFWIEEEDPSVRENLHLIFNKFSLKGTHSLPLYNPTDRSQTDGKYILMTVGMGD